MSWAADPNLSSSCSAAGAAAPEGMMRRWRLGALTRRRQQKEKDGKTRFFLSICGGEVVE